MAVRLKNSDPDFEAQFKTLLTAKRENATDINDAVTDIITEVRNKGDEALIELTARFDHLDLRETGLAITKGELDAAMNEVDKTTMQALELAATRINDHHEKQKPENQRYQDEVGVEIGYRWGPVSAAGL